jgi:glycosyltransferase involved in cell wall biosynthesis
LPTGGEPPIPRVSVVIPAYNVAGYIGEAIDSVLAQTFHDFEIIVVNDGSPDTVALDAALQPYAGRIRYLHKPNGGPSSARNAGVAAARSNLIAFLDGDDMWDPEYLASQMALLASHPSAAAATTDGVYFGETTLAGQRFSHVMPVESDRITIEAVLEGRSNISYSSLLYRQAFEQAGRFDESIRRSEDWDLFVRMLLAGQTILVNPQPLLRYRRRDASLSADSIVMRRAALDVLAKIESIVPPGSPLLPRIHNLRRDWRAGLERELGRKALAEGRWDQARTHWKEHQKIRPDRRIGLSLLVGNVSPGLLAAIMRRTGRL